MNPVILDIITFAGRRALGTFISCAILMILKIGVDSVCQARQNHNKLFNHSYKLEV